MFYMLPLTQQENATQLMYQSFLKIHVEYARYNRVCLHLPTIWSQWLIIYEELKSLKLSQRLGSCCRLFRVKIIKQISVVEFKSRKKTFLPSTKRKKSGSDKKLLR